MMESLQAQLISKTTPETPAETPEQELARLVKPEEYAYNLNIPQPVLEAVFNQDATVAGQGMHHLVNNLASIIHRNVLAATRKDLEKYKTSQTASTQEADFNKQRDAAQGEYFAAYPTHNDPMIKLIVAQQAQQLGAEYPQLPWGEQFKVALGARVEDALTRLRGGQPAAATPAPTPTPTPVTPTPKPASFLPVTPGNGGIPHFENDQEVIASTFSFN
jgi:hypothetical protein